MSESNNFLIFILTISVGSILLGLILFIIKKVSKKQWTIGKKIAIFLAAVLFTYMFVFGAIMSLTSEILIISKDKYGNPICKKEKVFFEYTNSNGEKKNVEWGTCYIDNTLSDSLDLVSVLYYKEDVQEINGNHDDKRIIIPGKTFMYIPRPKYYFEDPPSSIWEKTNESEIEVWVLKLHETEMADSI